MTYAPNCALSSFSVNQDGALIPEQPGGFSDPSPFPERAFQNNITEYRYEYDQNGNWTERTTVSRYVVDSSESGEHSTAHRRTLTYF